MKKKVFSFFQTSLFKKIGYGSFVIAVLFLGSIFFMQNSVEHFWIMIFLSGIVALLLGVLLETSSYKAKVERFLNHPIKWKITCCCCLVVLVFGTLCCGMQQFGGWDFSILVDSAWRFYQGQIPYETFVCTTPPGFLIGGMLAFKFFGVRWFSLVLIAAIYGGVTFLWSCWLLRQLADRRLVALLMALLLQSSTTFLAGFWWFNSITTIAGILFFLSALLFLRAPHSRYALFSYLGSLMLLLFMKPNTVGVEVIGITTVLFFSFSNASRARLIGLSIIALIGWVAMLSLLNINVINLLRSYAGIAHRAFTLKQFIDNNLFQMDVVERSLRISIWGALILLLLSLYRVIIYSFTPQKGIALITIIAGIFATINNCENALMSLQFILFGIWGVLTDFSVTNSKLLSKLRFLVLVDYLALIFLCYFLLGLSFGEGIGRNRVKGIGDFFDYTTSSETISGDFFEDVYASPLFVELHHALTASIPFYIARGASIWFGPRLGWAYADFGLPSPAGQPVTWERGVFYAPQQEPYLIQEWIEKKFDVLVFFKNDATYVPIELLQFIGNNYFLLQQQSLITIFCRKK